jgi:hypothetical protein
MRKYFNTLFDAAHRSKTQRFAVISVFLNTGAVFMGTIDNLPGILILIGGMCCLIFTFVHPWNRGKNYAIMAGLSIVLIMITFGMIRLMAALGYEQYISEGLVMSIIGLLCIPSIIVGAIGSIIYGEKAKPLNVSMPAK